jgi:hypothetical protein
VNQGIDFSGSGEHPIDQCPYGRVVGHVGSDELAHFRKRIRRTATGRVNFAKTCGV